MNKALTELANYTNLFIRVSCWRWIQRYRDAKSLHFGLYNLLLIGLKRLLHIYNFIINIWIAIIDIEINACPEQKQRPCIKHINDDWTFLLNTQLTIVLPNSVFVYLKVNYFPLSHLSCFKMCATECTRHLALISGWFPSQ